MFLILGLFLLVWVAGRCIFPFLAPFLLGSLLALAAEPPVRFLSGKLRLPRGLSAGISVAGIFLLGFGLLLSLMALLIQQLKFLSGILPGLLEGVGTGIRALEDWLLGLSQLAPFAVQPLLMQSVQELFSSGTAVLRKGAEFILGLAGGFLTHIPGRALSLATALISGFMISAKLPGIRESLKKQLRKEAFRPLIALWTRIRRSLGSWLKAQLKLAGVTFLILTCGFILLAVPFAPLWALVIACLDALPVLGTGGVLIPWCLLSLLEGNRVRALGLLGIYLTAALTRSVLEPKLVGSHLGLDPLITLAALYAGFKLWGFLGMILAPLLCVTALQLLPKPSDPADIET